MADISITKKHTLGVDGAKANLQKVADDLKKNYGIKSAWDGNTGTLSGTGLKKGTVEVTEDAVKVELTLGLLGKAMKGQIEKEINAKVDSVLS